MKRWKWLKERKISKCTRKWSNKPKRKWAWSILRSRTYKKIKFTFSTSQSPSYGWLPLLDLPLVAGLDERNRVKSKYHKNQFFISFYLNFKSIVDLPAVTKLIQSFLDIIVVLRISFSKTIFLIVWLDSLKVFSIIVLFWRILFWILIADGVSFGERFQNIWSTLWVLSWGFFASVLCDVWGPSLLSSTYVSLAVRWLEISVNKSFLWLISVV